MLFQTNLVTQELMFTASYISCPLSPATAYTNRHMSIHHHRGVAGSSAAPDLNNPSSSSRLVFTLGRVLILQ
jgi:hypothetical protein